MNLYSLLKVLDADQIIQVEQYSKTVFRGKPGELNPEYERHDIKCLWYSFLYKALMVEI